MSDPFDIRKYKTEVWKVNDDRLPPNDELFRIVPDDDFVSTIREHGQLDPVLMFHNEEEGWFLGDGAKRILSLRILNNENSKWDSILVRLVVGVYQKDAELISMIINAHRSDNHINNFIIMKKMFLADTSLTYKDIAAKIFKPLGYVRATFEKYSKIPDWALRAALDGKIAETTALTIGRFSKGIQAECKKQFEETGKLTTKSANQRKSAIQRDIVVSMSPTLGLSTRPQFYPAKVLEELKRLLDKGEYDAAKIRLEELLK